MERYNLRSSAKSTSNATSSTSILNPEFPSTNKTSPTSTLKSAFPTMDTLPTTTFTGTSDSNAVDFLRYFELFVTLKGLSEEGRRAAFLLSMRQVALTWAQTLSEAETKEWNTLTKLFIERFSPVEISKGEKMKSLWTIEQRPAELVRDFIDRVRTLALGLDVKDEDLLSAIQNGLKPSLRQFVIRQQPQTVDKLIELATLAEKTDIPIQSSISDDISTALQGLNAKLDNLQIHAITDKSQRSQIKSPSQDNDRRMAHRDRRRSQSPIPTTRNSNTYRQGSTPNFHDFCSRCNANHNARFCRHKNSKCFFLPENWTHQPSMPGTPKPSLRKRTKSLLKGPCQRFSKAISANRTKPMETEPNHDHASLHKISEKFNFRKNQ